MQYQIQTMPIWDAYRETDGCPLCKIYSDREKRLVGQYLAENVMDPDFRTESNRIGFCPEHIRQLYAGQNKLGLALQLETRAAEMAKLLSKPPTDKKGAKKTAEKIENHCGCVICNAIAEPMERYYMTIAQMYLNEKDFPELFREAHHCLKHSAKLFDAAQHAGKSITEYLAALNAGIVRDLNRTEKDMRAFADCFDFRNNGSKPDAQAIPRAIGVLIASSELRVKN
ncbi:MAG: hypothetical protein J1F71_02820 [Clostridiales bacterium]|nr:hypothetical protein [Clostridiales bacterium]